MVNIRLPVSHRACRFALELLLKDVHGVHKLVSMGAARLAPPRRSAGNACFHRSSDAKPLSAYAVKVRVHELRNRNKADLLGQASVARATPSGGLPYACSLLTKLFLCVQLKDLKTELAGLRVAKVTGGAPNKLSKMCGDRCRVQFKTVVPSAQGCFDSAIAP